MTLISSFRNSSAASAKFGPDFLINDQAHRKSEVAKLGESWQSKVRIFERFFEQLGIRHVFIACHRLHCRNQIEALQQQQQALYHNSLLRISSVIPDPGLAPNRLRRIGRSKHRSDGAHG